MFNELKMVIIPELAIFAEKDGKTIGFILSVPDANPGIRQAQRQALSLEDPQAPLEGEEDQEPSGPS